MMVKVFCFIRRSIFSIQLIWKSPQEQRRAEIPFWCSGHSQNCRLHDDQPKKLLLVSVTLIVTKESAAKKQCIWCCCCLWCHDFLCCDICHLFIVAFWLDEHFTVLRGMTQQDKNGKAKTPKAVFSLTGRQCPVKRFKRRGDVPLNPVVHGAYCTTVCNYNVPGLISAGDSCCMSVPLFLLSV